MGESIYGNARVYLELQHGFSGGWYLPIEVYFDITHGLQFEIRDASGSPVRSEPYSTGAFLPSPCWLTLPCDSIVRVRADPGWGSQRKTEGVSILLLNGGLWVIRPGSTNESFLSATVSPPTNHQSALKYNVWQGTLKLPKVKIPAKKP